MLVDVGIGKTKSYLLDTQTHTEHKANRKSMQNSVVKGVVLW